MEKNQRFSYLALFLSLLHIVLLDKLWLVYTIEVGLGYVIRVPAVKERSTGFRNNRKIAKN